MPKGGPRLNSGRKPVPLDVRAARGESVILRSFLPVPSWPGLSSVPRAPKTLDANGRKLWSKVVRHFLSNGCLAAVDLETISGYCHSVQRAMKAEALIAEFGKLTYSDNNGVVREHPAIKVAAGAWDAARRYQERFGFSWRDRSLAKVPLVPPVKLSPTEVPPIMKPNDPERFFTPTPSNGG